MIRSAIIGEPPKIKMQHISSVRKLKREAAELSAVWKPLKKPRTSMLAQKRAAAIDELHEKDVVGKYNRIITKLRWIVGLINQVAFKAFKLLAQRAYWMHMKYLNDDVKARWSCGTCTAGSDASCSSLEARRA